MSDAMTIDPTKIIAPHKVTDVAKLATLTAAMRNGGWSGRPVLVVCLPDGQNVALTGSHRLAAAVAAGLDEVPCLTVDGEEIAQMHTDAIDELIADCCTDNAAEALLSAIDDDDRLRALIAIGDADAVTLMRAE